MQRMTSISLGGPPVAHVVRVKEKWVDSPSIQYRTIYMPFLHWDNSPLFSPQRYLHDLRERVNFHLYELAKFLDGCARDEKRVKCSN